MEREPEPQTPAGMVDYRFTLANERTLLAWNRTAIALVAAGLGVAHLIEIERRGIVVALGAALAASGGIIAVLAYRRMTANARAIAEGRDLPPTSLPATLVAIVTAAAIAGVGLALLG